MKDGIYVIAKGQDALMPAQIAGDDGNQLFMICQKMGEAVMRKKVDSGRPFLAKANLEFVQYLTYDDVEFIRKSGVKQFMKPVIGEGI